MDFNAGFVPDEVKAEYLPSFEQKGLLDFVNPFEGLIGASNYSGGQGGGSSQDLIESSFNKFANSKSSQTADAASTYFDYDATKADRYVQSNYYKELGFNPNIDNETKYGNQQGWGDTIGQALSGGGKLAYQTFVSGWKGWGDMADALFSWDYSKLTGSPEQLAELAKDQEDIMNKYAIFSTPESDSGIFNRQFLGSMLQQGGFALGAMAQFLSEELITAGMSTEAGVAKFGATAARFAGRATRTGEVLADAKKLGDIWKSETLVSNILQGAKQLIPLANTAEDLTKSYRAGAGALQLGLIGAGGIKRALSEANMAFTEARMEAAGTYGDLYKRLNEEYISKNGQSPVGGDLEKIRNTAQKAAIDNFSVNSGILMLSNRIQFDNLFSKFGTERKILKEAGDLADDFVKVTGKGTTKLYNKGILGAAGNYNEMVADFGTKIARWEAAKSIGKGVFKWEASEGVQEILQDVSNNTMQDYYYDMYHGSKGYSRDRSLDKAIDKAATIEGAKTFLMGALTGRLLSPITYGIGKGVERLRTDSKQLEERESQKEEVKDLLNGFYEDPKRFLNEEIANFKVQDRVAADMKQAVANRDRYFYNNARDTSFAKMISAAKKTDMLESVLDTIREYGNNITPEQLKEGFGLENEDNNLQDTRLYFHNIANRVEEFSKNWELLKDKYSDLVMPQLFKEGSEGRFQAVVAKRALDDAIEILATNKHKSEQALLRARDIYAEVAKNEAIGASAATAFNTLGASENAVREINILKQGIKTLEENPDLDKESRDLLKTKQEQLNALEDWKDNWSASFGFRTKSEQLKGDSAFESYKRYVLSKNFESKIYRTIIDEDIAESFRNFVDYIDLNEDHKSYIDAYNTVANPTRFVTLHGKITDAIEAVRKEFMAEHARELLSEDDVDVTDEFDDENADPTNEPDGLEAPDSLSGLSGKKPTLDEYLRSKYDLLKPNNPEMPNFDVWAATAANGFITEYERLYGKPTDDNAGKSTTDYGDIDPTDVDIDDPEVTPEEIESYIKNEFGNQSLGQVEIGGYTIKVGDTINFEEVVAITEKAVALDKSGLLTYEEILNTLKTFNGKNLVNKNPTPVQTLVQTPLENGQIENVERVTNTAVNQNVDKQVFEKNKEIYGDSRKVINAGSKINARSDLYTWTKDPVTDRKRTGPNPDYAIVMGTPLVNTGTQITLRAETDIADFEQYDYLTNVKTNKTAADYFDADGKITASVDDFPVAIYTNINDKEVKLGQLPTMKWLDARKPNGETLNVLEFIEGSNGSKVNNLDINKKKLNDIRHNLFNNHNINSKFALQAVVNNKSEGILRVTPNLNKLSNVLHPTTKLGIIKNGMVTLNNGQVLNLPKDQIISNFDFKGKEGWPVVLIETPTGRTLVSYVSVPKLDVNNQNIVIQSWTAFHNVLDGTGNANDLKTVQAIYKAYGTELEADEKPDFNVLRGYINDYVTFLSGTKYDPLKEGTAQLNITEKGELSVWAVDTKDADKDIAFAKNPAEFTARSPYILDKLGKVYHNVKLSSDTAAGINSTEKKNFLEFKAGKLQVGKEQTYNEYIMNILETNIEKGVPVDPKDKNSKYVYFSNPVITFDKIEEVEQSVEEETVSEDFEPDVLEEPVSANNAPTGLDLTKSFGATVFDAGSLSEDDIDLDDLANMFSVRTTIQELQKDNKIQKQCE